MFVRRAALAVVAISVVAVACTRTSTTSTITPSSPTTSLADASGIDEPQHLIFIVQENRSFDEYFGTYPGADGIPTNPDGTFSVCVPDKFQASRCMAPYVTRSIEQD